MILDIIISIIFIITTLHGKRNGFSDTIIHLLSLILSIVLGVMFTGNLTNFIIDNTTLDEFISKNAGEHFGSTTLSFPSFIPEAISQPITTNNTTLFSASPTSFAVICISILSFLIIVFLVSIASNILNRTLAAKRKNKTIIGTVDSSVGLVLGMVKGALFVFLFLALMLPAAGIFFPGYIHIINESLNNSYFAGYLYDNNPLFIIIDKFTE